MVALTGICKLASESIEEAQNPTRKTKPRGTKYPCIYCGKQLVGAQKRYHANCRRRQDDRRRSEGTPATDNEVKNLCANPKCNTRLAGSQQRYCSPKCKQSCYRLRKKRAKLLATYQEERKNADKAQLSELDFLIRELDDLLQPQNG